MARTGTVVVAQFGAAHGIKGEVRLKSFTQEPMAVAGYGALSAADGRSFEIEAIRPAAGTSPDIMVVRLKGVRDRTAAEKLTGLELSVAAERLPPPAVDEFYHSDLIGLSAMTTDGQLLGAIVAVPNYGAGDLIEIAALEGGTILIPFTQTAVPKIDIAGGRVVVVPPPFDDDGDDDDESAGASQS
jgi:16S rRNA processing protein RimM